MIVGQSKSIAANPDVNLHELTRENISIKLHAFVRLTTSSDLKTAELSMRHKIHAENYYIHTMMHYHP